MKTRASMHTHTHTNTHTLTHTHTHRINRVVLNQSMNTSDAELDNPRHFCFLQSNKKCTENVTCSGDRWMRSNMRKGQPTLKLHSTLPSPRLSSPLVAIPRRRRSARSADFPLDGREGKKWEGITFQWLHGWINRQIEYIYVYGLGGSTEIANAFFFYERFTLCWKKLSTYQSNILHFLFLAIHDKMCSTSFTAGLFFFASLASVCRSAWRESISCLCRRDRAEAAILELHN